MEKYIKLAKSLKMKNAVVISPDQIAFDIRAILKCRWGCEDYFLENNIRCSTRGTTYEERVAMVKSYSHILLLHSHNVRQLSKAVLEIERTAFLDGYYFVFANRITQPLMNINIQSPTAPIWRRANGEEGEWSSAKLWRRCR